MEQVRGDGVGDRNPERHVQTSVILAASTPSQNVKKAHLQCFLLLKYECLRERQTDKQREEGGRDRQRARDRKVERGDREEPGLNACGRRRDQRMDRAEQRSFRATTSRRSPEIEAPTERRLIRDGEKQIETGLEQARQERSGPRNSQWALVGVVRA